MTGEECVLCRKLAELRQLPAEEVVWEFPHSVALLGPWQYFTGYCILIARRHATELSQLPDDLRRWHLEEMCLLARAIEQTFRPRKLNYELLGNQAPHVHWHLFPRRDDDPDLLKPVWLALDRAERDEQEKTRLQTGSQPRPAIAAALRQTLSSLLS